MSPIQLVMFDLDGTLIETAPEISDAVNDTLRDAGLPPVSLADVQRWIGHGTFALLVTAVASATGQDIDQVRDSDALRALAPTFDQHYEARCGSRSHPYPGVRETLDVLRAQGVRMAVVTNKEARYTEAILTRHGLRAYFDVVISGNSLPARKPDPSGVLSVMQQLGVSPERTLFVGDSSIDVATARNAGIAVHLFPHGYNLGQSVHDAGADRVLDNFDQLRSLFTTTATRHLRAVLWDVDGTLAETEREGHRVAFNQAFSEHGLDWHWDIARYGELLNVTGGRERLLFDMASRNDAPASIEQRESLARQLHLRKNRIYADLVAQGLVPLRDGVEDLWKSCLRAGVRMGIVTTTSRANVEALLGAHLGPHWAEHFACVICGEDVQAKKPDPEAYRLALQQLQLPARQVIAVEDSPGGLRAAQDAGIATVVTPSTYFQDDPHYAHAMAVGPGFHLPKGWRAPQGACTIQQSPDVYDLDRWLCLHTERERECACPVVPRAA
ncbi:MAG: phosphoglycolate phosphatase [Lysobacteraceae bacterium]